MESNDIIFSPIVIIILKLKMLYTQLTADWYATGDHF